MSALSPVTRAQLAAAFRELGLGAGDTLILHSSLSSLGHVEGGAEAVIDALLEVIGGAGNLMLPTFNYSRPIPEPYYDPETTPCRTGAIPETGRKHSGAVRSLHPTHSVAVIGPKAVELTRDHLACRAFGIGSPIDRLAQMDGKVLLLGVGHISNSLIHVAEEYAGVPKVSVYPDPLPVFKVRMPDGSIQQHPLDTSPSCSAAFGGAEYVLRRHGEIRDCRGFGSCMMQLMSGKAVLQRVTDILVEKPDVLLCTHPGCRPCTGARTNLRNQRRISQ